MRIRDLVLSIIIFVALFNGLLSFYTGFATSYNVTYTSPALVNPTSQFMNITNSINSNMYKILHPDFSLETLTAPIFLFSNSVLFLFSVPGLIISVITSVLGLPQLGILHIPDWLIGNAAASGLIFTIVMIFIMFKIFSLLTGGKEI